MTRPTVIEPDDPIPAPEYDDAREAGEVVHQGGYHQPQNAHFSARCGCELDTAKGAYRDVVIEVPTLGDNEPLVAHYYHQSPVVVELDGVYRLSNYGYQTRTTKERINDHTPLGVKVVQEDYDWYVKLYDPDAPFDKRDPECIPFENETYITAE